MSEQAKIPTLFSQRDLTDYWVTIVRITGGNIMELLDGLLNVFFNDSTHDLVKFGIAALVWHELRGMRASMDAGFAALTARIDNHERRLGVLEPDDAAGTAD